MTDQPEMSEFEKQISALVHAELRDALAAHDRDRVAGIIEKLASSLGTAIAISAGGMPKAIDEMLTGVEGYLAEVAATMAPLGAMIRSGKALMGETWQAPR